MSEPTSDRQTIEENSPSWLKLIKSIPLLPGPPVDRDSQTIEKIIISFSALKSHGTEPKGYIFWEAVNPLIEAIKSDKWDLVAAAVNYEIVNLLPENSPEKLAQITKMSAYKWSEDDSRLSKGEILRLIEKFYPEHYKTIPKHKSQLTKWWKSVGPQAEQMRGYEPSLTSKSADDWICDPED
jgi:hypothetical protein